MIKANYLTVNEFKNFNPEVDFTNYNDTTISGMISRASANIDNYLQYSLAVEDIVDEKNEAIVSSNGNLMIYTTKYPIISVAAISLKLGTAHIDLSLVDGAGNARYDIPVRARNILYPYQEIAFTGTLSVRNFFSLRNMQIFTKTSYRAGYDTIPDDLKDAVNLWTKDIFIRQSNPMDLVSASQGAVSMQFKNRALNPDSEDSKWIQDAKGILQSYRKYTS